MLFSIEQAFVGRNEKRAPLKTPALEAKPIQARGIIVKYVERSLNINKKQKVSKVIQSVKMIKSIIITISKFSNLIGYQLL